MASHTKEQREFIVRRLAAFETPAEIARAFAARFSDTTCAEMDVLATDPRVNIVDPDLHALFFSERERVLSDVTLAPMAEQRARLIVLSRQVESFQRDNRPADVRAVLRQIAEEMGVLGGKAGKSNPAASSGQTPAFESVEVLHTIVDPKSAA